MRLSNQEKKTIIESIDQTIVNLQNVKPKGALLLFGSRTDPSLKGGDIDLVIIVENEMEKNNWPHYTRITSAIKWNLGDEKIDLAIITKDKSKEIFWAQALKNAVLLKIF